MKDHEQVILTARLLSASPEVVFEELKAFAGLTRSERGYRVGDSMEELLLARNEPLIDLALARYAGNDKVLKQLYEREARKLGPTSLGVRVAVLSNLGHEGLFDFDFPKSIVGEDELKFLLNSEEEHEVSALLFNPRASYYLLSDLFLKKGLFAELPERRWLHLIVLASDNERIFTRNDTVDGPDLGHMKIEKSIFELVKSAPATPGGLGVMHHFLMRLDPSHTIGDGNLAAVLSHWDAVDARDYKGNVEDGYYTPLSLKDEFRCLVAAHYGRYYDGTSKIEGNQSSEDVAFRCSYYANAKLTEKDLEAGCQRDKGTFVLAALWNDELLSNKKLRTTFEEQYLSENFNWIYRRRLAQLKKRRPYLDLEPSTDLEGINETSPSSTPAPAKVPNYSAQFLELSKKIASIERTVTVGFIVLAIFIYYHH